MFFNRRLKYANSRIWKSNDSVVFPEQQNNHPDSLGEKAKVGVCFSGGGTRSATCTHGQLKALHSLGLLQHIGYISCVSGGAWAAVPFTFLDTHWNESHFFGSIAKPESLNLEHLNNIHPKNYLHTVTNAGVIDDLIEHWAKFAGDETYSRIIGDIFLEHFQLNSREKFFANSENHVEDILSRNEKMRRDDFYIPQPGRPFLIVNAALLRPGKKDYLFEMTPWYSGVQPLYPNGGSRKRPVGGGYIESFAMDSDSPETMSDGTADVRIGSRRYRFTLSDVLGTTGAAPAEVLHNVGLRFIGFPEFKHWPIMNIGEVKAKEYDFGDGGNIENLGILALLKRKVRKIVVFVNTKKELPSKDTGDINKAVTDLFTSGNVNHVFEETKLIDLTKNLNYQVNEGKAAIHNATYRVLPNDHHAIEGDYDVEVLWVYNHNYKNWIELLPDESKKMIGNGKLSNFPHYATFMENIPKFIDLYPIQANLLSHMSCAIVRDNAEEFKRIILS